MKNNILLISNNLDNSINTIFEKYEDHIDVAFSSRSPSGFSKSMYLGFQENEDPLLINNVLNLIDQSNEKYCLLINDRIIKTNLSLSDKEIFQFFVNIHNDEEQDELINFIKYS